VAKRIVILVIFLFSILLVNAQELSEAYTFVDGTTINHPSDFLPFDKAYDRATFSNNQSEIFVAVIFERTRLAQELNSLPKVLEWWADPSLAYDIGDEEMLIIGDQEAIRFVSIIDDNERSYERIYILLESDSGSAVLFRIQPDIRQDFYILEQEDLILSIVASTHFVDLRAGTETVLENSFVFDDGMMIEYSNPWTLDTETQALQSNRLSLQLSAFTPEELAEKQLKNDPIEILYYEAFAPNDSEIVFDPSLIIFLTIRGIEGLSYTFNDRRDDEIVQHTYFVANLDNGTIVALDFVASSGTTVLDSRDVQDMIQTIRPEGTLPPFALIPMGNPYDLASITISYPDYWFLSEGDNGAISLSSLATNIFIFPISAEELDADDLATSLLDQIFPFDEDVSITPDDVELMTLNNGLEMARTRYIETEDRGNTYQRLVLLVRLADDSALMISIAPQPGIFELTNEAEAEAMAIINTIDAP
jgi:hypothetical protein